MAQLLAAGTLVLAMAYLGGWLPPQYDIYVILLALFSIVALALEH
jgi:hypothetical protein